MRAIIAYSKLAALAFLAKLEDDGENDATRRDGVPVLVVELSAIDGEPSAVSDLANKQGHLAAPQPIHTKATR